MQSLLSWVIAGVLIVGIAVFLYAWYARRRDMREIHKEVHARLKQEQRRREQSL